MKTLADLLSVVTRWNTFRSVLGILGTTLLATALLVAPIPMRNVP